jgi:hypothetical protein
MLISDAFLVEAAESSGIIDYMEAATYVYTAEDLKFLAAYQAQIVAATVRTTSFQDLTFLSLIMKYFVVKQNVAA